MWIASFQCRAASFPPARLPSCISRENPESRRVLVCPPCCNTDFWMRNKYCINTDGVLGSLVAASQQVSDGICHGLGSCGCFFPQKICKATYPTPNSPSHLNFKVMKAYSHSALLLLILRYLVCSHCWKCLNCSNAKTLKTTLSCFPSPVPAFFSLFV